MQFSLNCHFLDHFRQISWHTSKLEIDATSCKHPLGVLGGMIDLLVQLKHQFLVFSLMFLSTHFTLDPMMYIEFVSLQKTSFKASLTFSQCICPFHESFWLHYNFFMGEILTLWKKLCRRTCIKSIFLSGEGDCSRPSPPQLPSPLHWWHQKLKIV